MIHHHTLEHYTERAAIIEYCGGYPRGIAERSAAQGLQAAGVYAPLHELQLADRQQRREACRN